MTRNETPSHASVASRHHPDAPTPTSRPNKRAGCDGDGEEGSRRECFTEFEVGHVPADLHCTHGSIHQEQMSDEPGGGNENSGQVEGEPEDVPVGEV